MLPECFTNSKSIKNMDYDPANPDKEPEYVQTNYANLPEEIRGSVDDVVAWYQRKIRCKNEIDTLNNTIATLNQGREKPIVEPTHVEAFPQEEQERREKIHNDFIDNYVRYTYKKVIYADHVVDDMGYRFYSDAIMHRTADKEADLEYNQKVRKYIEMAREGKFRDGSEDLKDPEVAAAKAEFIQMHRDFLKKAEVFDLAKLATGEYTDADLAAHAGEFHEAALLGGQFDNVKKNFKDWGITDEECTNTMNKFQAWGDYVSYINQRLSQILSPSYMYYDDGPVIDALTRIDDLGRASETDLMFEDMANATKTVKGFAINAELNYVYSQFRQIGINAEDVGIIDPKTGNILSASDALDVCREHPDLTFVSKNDPEVRATYHISMDMPYTRARMLDDGKKPKYNLSPVPEKPAALKWTDKFADFFSNIFTGKKPRQEAYDAAMNRRNEAINAFKQMNTSEDKRFKDLVDSYANKSNEKSEKQESKAAVKKSPVEELAELGKFLNSNDEKDLEKFDDPNVLMDTYKQINDLTTRLKGDDAYSEALSSLMSNVTEKMHDYTLDHPGYKFDISKQDLKSSFILYDTSEQKDLEQSAPELDEQVLGKQ